MEINLKDISMVSIKNNAGLEHLTELVQFQKEMALETEDLALDESTLMNGMKAVINDPSKGKYYLAWIDDKLVGMLLTIKEWSDWRAKNVIWIHSVYILPDYRAQGIFKKMYLALKEKVEDNPALYAGLRLYVDKTNQEASYVYEKLGMTKEHYDLYEWLN